MAIAIAFVIATLIPVLLGFLFSVPTGKIFTLIISTLVLQANAAFVGMGLGLHPLFILVVMTLVELGIVLAIYEILDTFAEQSERVRRFTKSTEEKMARYPILHKYGAVTLIILPALPVIGLTQASSSGGFCAGTRSSRSSSSRWDGSSSPGSSCSWRSGSSR